MPILEVTATSVRAQIPFETPVGDATAVLQGAATASAPFAFTVNEAAPAILSGADGRAVASNDDGSPNGPDNPVAAGGTVTLSLTGQGLVDPPVVTGDVPGVDVPSVPVLPLTATVAGQDATVTASLQAGVVGVLQVMVTMPAVDAGDQIMVVSVGGHASNEVVVSVAGS